MIFSCFVGNCPKLAHFLSRCEKNYCSDSFVIEKWLCAGLNFVNPIITLGIFKNTLNRGIRNSQQVQGRGSLTTLEFCNYKLWDLGGCGLRQYFVF